MAANPANQNSQAAPAGQAAPADRPVSRIMSQEDKEIISLMKPYITATRRNPYHPKSWLDTAEAFMGKYNELACADALKAHILCDEYVRELLPADAEVPKLSGRDLGAYRDNACWVLYMALKELGASDDASEYYDQVPPVLLLPSRIPKVIDMESWDKKTKPMLGRNNYPFLLGRQPKAIEAARDRIADAYIKNSMRIDKASFAGEADVYGVFATKNIDVDRTLLQDPIVKADLVNGKDDAQKPAMVLFEHVIKEVVSNLEQPAQDSILTRLGNSALTVHYGGEPEDFSFKHLVKRIAMILLKNDHLFDSRFDFYKWFTVYWKLCTNSFTHQIQLDNGKTKKEVVGVAPLYSFFNHSCEPNAKWSPTEKKNSDDMFMEVKTIKKIAENDEIFIPYITDEELAKPVAERRAILKDWFGGDCMCTKCVAEVEALEQKAKKAEAVADAKAVALGKTASRLEGVRAPLKRSRSDTRRGRNDDIRQRDGERIVRARRSSSSH